MQHIEYRRKIIVNFTKEAETWIFVCLPTPSGPPKSNDHVAHINVSAMVSCWPFRHVTPFSQERLPCALLTKVLGKKFCSTDSLLDNLLQRGRGRLKTKKQ